MSEERNIVYLKHEGGQMRISPISYNIVKYYGPKGELTYQSSAGCFMNECITEEFTSHEDCIQAVKDWLYEQVDSHKMVLTLPETK